MAQPIDRWEDIEREEREAILQQFEKEAHAQMMASDRGESILGVWRAPLEFAFAAMFGVLCGLIAVLLVVVLRIVLG